MNKSKYCWMLIASALAIIGPKTVLAQTEGVLVLDEKQQKLITQVQDRATNRRLKEQAEVGNSGPLGNALALSTNINDGFKSKDLEKVSDAWWKGKQAGVPEFFAKRRDAKMTEAREAAQDAVELIQATAQRSARAAKPLAIAAGVSGDAAEEISKDMREVEKEKQELVADLREHAERLSHSFPELRHILMQSGLTSAGVREIVISRLREANQLIYEAGLAETNRLMWENVPRIVRSRYPNAGEPQVIATQSAAEVIKSANREKVFK